MSSNETYITHYKDEVIKQINSFKGFSPEISNASSNS